MQSNAVQGNLTLYLHFWGQGGFVCFRERQSLACAVCGFRVFSGAAQEAMGNLRGKLSARGSPASELGPFVGRQTILPGCTVWKS